MSSTGAAGGVEDGITGDADREDGHPARISTGGSVAADIDDRAGRVEGVNPDLSDLTEQIALSPTQFIGIPLASSARCSSRSGGRSSSTAGGC